MSTKKDRTDKITGLTAGDAEQPDIFGRSKSREEIKAEEKARKKKELEALREARRRAKAARREEFKKQKHPELWVIGIFLAVLVVVSGVLLAVQMVKDSEKRQYEPDESMSQFWNSGVKPELSEEGLTAAVNRVYYTRGGQLCVYMTIGNGSGRAQHMSSLDVQIRNGDTGEVIAGGYTDDISPEYTVPAQDYNEYHFIISPEFVSIKDDPLSKISYTITAAGYADEE